MCIKASKPTVAHNVMKLPSSLMLSWLLLVLVGLPLCVGVVRELKELLLGKETLCGRGLCANAPDDRALAWLPLPLVIGCGMYVDRLSFSRMRSVSSSLSPSATLLLLLYWLAFCEAGLGAESCERAEPPEPAELLPADVLLTRCIVLFR